MWIEIADRRDYSNSSNLHGLRIRVDKGIDELVRKEVLRFGCWLRKRYYFPIRINLHLFDENKFYSRDSKKTAIGLFFETDEKKRKFPVIWIAAKQTCGLRGIILTIAHELTHYFQWHFRQFDRSNRSLEIEANRWAYYIVDELYDCVSE